MELYGDRKKMGLPPGIKKKSKRTSIETVGGSVQPGKQKPEACPQITEKNTPIQNCMFT